MTSERIKEIQDETGYPDSISVMLALNQVWNECVQAKNWISVNDKMPEVGEDDKSNFVNVFLIDSKILKAYRYKGHWFGEDNYDINNVTHWKPLLKAPKS